MLVEVCVQNLEDALAVEGEGADRIELCSELETGGTTPPAELISDVVKQLNIPVHVLMRPRAGDFVYTASEIKSLFEDIQTAINLGAKGIVTGILKQDGTIDVDKMEEIREVCADRHLTFHRAFDLVPDPLMALSQMEALGINTVLTSGQCNSAVDGLDLLVELKSKSRHVTIMPGGGVRPANILQFKDSGFKAIHFSGTSSQTPSRERTNGGHFSISDLEGSKKLKMQLEVVRKMIRSVK